mgnify:CR=1 FL=1
MKKILFAASECVPFIKTGGLADVCGALPKTFDHKDWDVRVVIPNYSCIPEKYRSQYETGMERQNGVCDPFLYGMRFLYSK